MIGDIPQSSPIMVGDIPQHPQIGSDECPVKQNNAVSILENPIFNIFNKMAQQMQHMFPIRFL